MRNFEMISESFYRIPIYSLPEPGANLQMTVETVELPFLKGGENGHNGIITEDLLSALIDHLTKLNVGDLRNRETSVTITKLEEARMWLEERKRNRKARGVFGTKKS